MKHIAALILSLVLAATSAAELHDCVGEVSCPPCGGSCTLVAKSRDGHGLAISVWHVFEEGDTSRITCKFGGKRYRARLIGTDKRYDLAALDIEHAPELDMPPAIVAARKEDGPFTCVGFPWNAQGTLRWTRGLYLGYAGDGESAWLPSMLHTKTHVISGYSGGARFNRFGEYVGPISGMTGEGDKLDRTWGASGDALLKFVARYTKARP